MADELTSSEMTELQALSWLEPDIGQRIDEGFAQLLSLVFNRTRGGKEKPKTALDFMPERGPIDRKAVAEKVTGQFDILKRVEREKRKRKDGD